MKKFLFIWIVGLVLTGCVKEDDSSKVVTDEKIEKLYKEIEPLADAILLSGQPDWSALAAKYKDRKEIKEMDVREDCFAIEFANGEIRGWLLPPPASTTDNHLKNDLLQLSSDILEKIQTKSNTLEEKTPSIAFVNSNWHISEGYKDYISDIVIPAFNKTWSVTEANGKRGATLDFFANKLSDYDVVFIYAHGGLALNNKIWIETGEEATAGVIEKIKVTLGVGKTAVFNQTDYVDGKQVITSHVFISGDFISDNYAGSPFPNSFIYLASCHGLQYPEKFAKHFVDHGAKVVAGWNETNCIGLIAGASLLYDYMFIDRYNLADAITRMPNEAKINNHRNSSAANPQCLPPNPHYAELVYYGRDEGSNQSGLYKGGDYRLYNNEEVVIINGIRWATRNVATPGAFAANPESYGSYYQWNRGTTDWTADWNGIGSGSVGPGSVNSRAPLLGWTGNWARANDPCPTGWHIPSETDFSKLRDQTKVASVWTTINNVNGRRFTDIANSNTLFLPAAGSRDYTLNGNLSSINILGSYWCIPIEANTYSTSFVIIHANGSDHGWSTDYQRNGNNIRCVKD